jgi:hypothetical protein
LKIGITVACVDEDCGDRRSGAEEEENDM